jgi:phenylalanyl-tRNA synthetase alpha chain
MQQEALDAIQGAETLEELQAVKTKYVGKSGLVTKELGGLGKLPPDERKVRGAEINAVRAAIDEALTAREALLKRTALDARLASEAIDVTLPGLHLPSGGLHLITRILDDLTDIYERLGYAVIEGNEVEDGTTRPATSGTPSGSKTAACCAPTPAPCRCATWSSIRPP